MEKGWENYNFFKNYYMHNIEDQVELANVYHSTMVNLYNNTHGFGLHQRVLECMSVGGFNDASFKIRPTSRWGLNF